MKLTNVAAAALLLAGVGLVGCQDKPAPADGSGDRMYPSENNMPTGERSGSGSVAGSNADGPDAALRNDMYQRGPNSTNANGGTNTTGGSMAPYNGVTPTPQSGGSGGSAPVGTSGR